MPDRKPKQKPARREKPVPVLQGSFYGDLEVPDRKTLKARRETTQFPTAFVIVFFFVGLAALVTALLTGSHALRTLQRQISAPGRVVETIDRRQASGTGSDRFYNYPVVEFTAGGQLQRVEMSSGSAPPQYRPGDEVTVLYDPANIQSARIRDGSTMLELWLLPGILSIFALVFTPIGFLAIWLYKRQIAELDALEALAGIRPSRK